MAGKSSQPSNEPPHRGRKTGTRHADKTVEKKGGEGRGDSLQGVPMLRKNTNAQKNAKTPTNRYDAQRSKNTRNPDTCAYLTNR